MSVNFTKRILAYLIDLLFLGSIIIFIYQFIPEPKVVTDLQTDIAVLNEEYLNRQIETSSYLRSYSNLIYDVDQKQVIFPIINFITIFLYFVIVPFLLQGQTIGKYIMKIRIESNKEKLSIFTLTVRNLIVNGLGYLILSFLALLFVPKNMYLYVISILGIIQLGLVITSAFMIIYRKDKKGIQDILTNTKVVKK